MNLPTHRRAVGIATGALLALVVWAMPAGAHVSVAPSEAPSGGFVKLDVRVPHGCDGAPTEVVRVQIPKGATSVKPQVVAGWTIEVVSETFDKPEKGPHGEEITERVSEIVWRGGPLEDGHLEEFGISLKLPEGKAGDVVHFGAIQECPGGKELAWIEIPADGESHDDLENPAPSLTLTAAKGGHGHGDDEGEGHDDAPTTEAIASTGADDGTDPLALVALVLGGLGLLVGGGALATARRSAA